MPPTHLTYTVTLTRPDGSVVKTITVPVLQETADAGGNASSRLDFGTEVCHDDRRMFHREFLAERNLRSDLSGLEHAACGDANDRAIEACQDADNAGERRRWGRQD